MPKTVCVARIEPIYTSENMEEKANFKTNNNEKEKLYANAIVVEYVYFYYTLNETYILTRTSFSRYGERTR